MPACLCLVLAHCSPPGLSLSELGSWCPGHPRLVALASAASLLPRAVDLALPKPQCKEDASIPFRVPLAAMPQALAGVLMQEKQLS